jgi:uncharacterized protein (TIGR03118 family)
VEATVEIIFRKKFTFLASLIILAGCGGSGNSGKKTAFLVTNLVADQAGSAPQTDPNLVNAWGISLSQSGGNFWVSANGTDKSTVYSGDVNGSPFSINPLVVTIPGGAPTGQVFNSSSDFVVTSGAASAPALFIFAGEDGTISGWNPGVPPPATSTAAQVGATVPGALYKGLAIGNNGSGNHLYAANFATGTVDVFDGSFNKVTLAGSFSDPGIPAGFNPFNVANLGGTLYVAYAKKEAGGDDDEPGPGNGYVSKFDLNGNFLGRLVTQGHLNSPWGMIIAPSSFGKFAGTLLVGNFGDGWINAYSPTNGSYKGALRTKAGAIIAIDGLWGLAIGNGTTAGDTSAVYFAAGPADETHGLFGKITVEP